MEQYLPSYLKTKNRKMLFDLIRQNGSLSRTEIAKITCMSFPTVIKTADALLQKGVIKEDLHQIKSTGAGRRAHRLHFCANSLLAVGIEFEGRYAKVGLVSMSGDVLCKEQLTIGSFKNEDDLLPLANAVDSLLTKYAQAHDDTMHVLGIGIGFPANFNPLTGDIVSFKKMLISVKTPFKQMFPKLASRLTLPLYLDNDVNLVCNGEAFMRAKEMSLNNMVFISLGTGCGAACRINGALFYGSHFMAGEIGRMSLCGYTNNNAEHAQNLEDIISLESLERKFGIHKEALGSLDANKSKMLCDYIAKPLATVIYNISAAMDIELFILGGIVPQALGLALFEAITREAALFSCHNILGGVHIKVLPSVVSDAGIIGAATAVFDKEIDCFLEN